MRFKRRGFRRGTFISARERKDDKKTLPLSWEEFYDEIIPMLRPAWTGDKKRFSELYHGFQEEDQKKLTHKLAGQILDAHRDVVSDVFKRLSKISLDLSQQTEVEYRRLKLVDKFF